MQNNRHNPQILYWPPWCIHTTCGLAILPTDGCPLTNHFTAGSHSHFNHRALGATYSKLVQSRMAAAFGEAL